MTSLTTKIDIKELTRDQLVMWLNEHDIRPFRAGQVFKWIYMRQADSFDTMTDISKGVRDLFKSHFTINRLERVRLEHSEDGTRKYLFRLHDGKYIESVLIPEKKRLTLCISSQVGCSQGCKFCLTAKGGYKRNLSTGEINAQIIDVQNELGASRNITSIVLMGMGEPLANYKNVLSAVNIMTDTDFGLKFSTRRVTISTSGLVPRLSDLGRDTKINLAISLNASDNKTRNELMPINRKYSLESLIEACSRYPLLPRQKVTFEYILIKGVNDSTDDARRLAKLLKPVKSKINLIPLNEFAGCEFKRSDDSAIHEFQDILYKSGYPAIIRHSRGNDISAACGQLSANAMPL